VTSRRRSPACARPASSRSPRQPRPTSSACSESARMFTERLRGRSATVAALCATGLFAFAAAPLAAPAPATTPYDTFVQSVATDRSDAVRRMLAQGMDANTLDPNGDPVLLVAARAGWEPTLDALLAAGAKVDAQNAFGDRPLMVAALNGHLA